MDNKTRRIPWGIIGLTLGAAAVGAAIGVLYAPKKGEETRKDVKDWLAARREKTRNFLAKSKVAIVEKKELLTSAFKNRHEAVNGAKEKELVGA